MTAESDYRLALAAYPAEYRSGAVEDLGSAGGFSGARFWRVTTAGGIFCLRRWPREHPAPERLEFIQAVLWHVDREGFGLVPVPVETRTHAGYVRSGGYLWELAPWMPGRADYLQHPSPAKLRDAMSALAGFHVAAESFPLPDPDRAPSPGILQRIDQLRTLMGGEITRVAASVRPEIWPGLEQPARSLLALFPRVAQRVVAQLSAAAELRVRVQPCIRDIWHDHVLFDGSTVTGLIDFGAMRAESVAADVARLLGSMVGDDPQGWQNGLDAYSGIRRLTPTELVLVTAFDHSAVVLGGVNWLNWIYCQGREFEDHGKIVARLESNVRRLAHLAEAA
jgi:Ser/Thr protein kinase RdoA (MazF antagonist)